MVSSRECLTKSARDLNDVTDDLREVSANVTRGENKLLYMQKQVEKLQKKAQMLKDNATSIQIQEVGGQWFGKYIINRYVNKRSMSWQLSF